MKSIFLLLCFCGVLFAEEHTCNFSEYYGEPNEAALRDQKLELLSLESQYSWLYLILMPVEYQSSNYRARSKKTFYTHMVDTLRYFPDPNEMANMSLRDLRDRTINGKITYVGFVKLPYRYDVLFEKDGSVTLLVKVHFKNPQRGDLEQIREKFIAAEEKWNLNPMLLRFPYQYSFEVVTNARDAHFSVTLKDKTRGPYLKYWSRNWSHRTMAHELGHMMGLGDEYRTLSGTIDCLKFSLMCTTGRAMKLHHYFVMRRLFFDY